MTSGVNFIFPIGFKRYLVDEYKTLSADVKPEDIQSIAYEVLRHRILLTYEAEAEEITSDQIISKILSKVTVP